MSFSQDEINSLVERAEAIQAKARKRNIIAIIIPTVAAISYLVLTGFLIHKVQDELVQKQKVLQEMDGQLDQKKQQIGQLDQQIADRNTLISKLPQQDVQVAYSKVSGIEQQSRLVYIQIRSPLQIKAAQGIADHLVKQGYIVPDLEQVGRGTVKSTQVRYFRKQDQADAQTLVNTLQGLGVNGQVVAQLTKSNKPNTKHFEVWFSPDFN